MYHPSRKGIYCDLCGEEVLIKNEKITYYSINMKEVTDNGNSKNIDDVLDLDFCGGCHSRMRERVLKISELNNQKRAKYGKPI